MAMKYYSEKINHTLHAVAGVTEKR